MRFVVFSFSRWRRRGWGAARTERWVRQARGRARTRGSFAVARSTPGAGRSRVARWWGSALGVEACGGGGGVVPFIQPKK